MRRSRGTLHTWVHIIEKYKRKLPSQENDGLASQPHLDFFLLEKVFTYQVSQQVLERNLAKNR